MYEINIQLTNGSIDRVTPFAFPDPMPNQDDNGVINITTADGVNVGIINPFDMAKIQTPTPLWLNYVQVEAEGGLGIDDINVYINPPNWTTASPLSRIFVETGVTAAPALSRQNGPVIPRGSSIVIEAVAIGPVSWPAGDHRIVLGIEPLKDGEECCAYQAGQNTFELVAPPVN